jgi:hypothetical protein
MGNFNRVTGKIERVWDNATTGGVSYKVVELENGERYSLWRKGDFEKVSKGDEIDFDYSRSGKFKNIERIYNGSEVAQENPGSGQDAKDAVKDKYTGPGKVNGGNGGSEYTGDRLDKMIKMSYLKSASSLMAGSKVAYGDRAEKTIELAKQFERYINDELLEGDSQEPPGKEGP